MNDEDNNAALHKLLSSIFFWDKTNNAYKIIKDTTNIPELLSMLNSSSASINIRHSILTILKNAFGKIRHYIEIVARYYITSDDNKQINIYLILLKQYCLYIDRDDIDIDNENKEGGGGGEGGGDNNSIIALYTQTIITVLELLIANVTCPIEVFEYIYALFKPYLLKDIQDNKKLLTKKRFYVYFNLLCIIYGKLERTVASQYFYFSGQGEMTVSFDPSIIKDSHSLISFEEPFAIFTWFRIGISREDMKATFSKSECNLIRVLQSNKCKTDITLDLNNSLRSSSDSELSLELHELKWYMLTMAFSPISDSSSSNSIEVKIYLNSKQVSLGQAQINKKTPISSISLFKNFIGEATTVFIVKEKKYANLFSIFQNRRFKFGINSEKGLIILNKTLQNDAYINYPSTYVQNIVRINQKKDFSAIKDFALLYMPNRYEEESDTVIKIKHCNINARIEMSSVNLNGVHIHKRHSKNISMVQGLYHLLPIAEMIGISNSPLNPYPLLTNILTQEVINEFCMLIGVIKGNLSKNKSSKELINFIRFFSLFLEKLPRELFSSNMFEYLKTLVISKDFTIQKKKETVSFINEMTIHIFLNKIIYFKFDIELQEKIWGIIETYSITNQWCSITMHQICDILVEYDKEKNTKYCCAEHAKSFNDAYGDNCELKIANTKVKIKPMTNVIIYILQNNPAEIEMFYGLLTREASPCLQTFIITVTASLLEKKGSASKRLLESLNRHQFFINVSLFVLSFAVFEVRYELIELIFAISQRDPSIQFTSYQSLLIQNNVTPVYMVININEIDTQKGIKSVHKDKDKAYEENGKEKDKLISIEQNEPKAKAEDEQKEIEAMNEEDQISLSYIQIANDTTIHSETTYDQLNIIANNESSISNGKLSKEEIEELKKNYFPQSLNQDTGMKEIKGYQRITLKENEQFISNYYNETEFKETLNKMFVYLFFKITEHLSKSLILSCIIKISPLLDIACITTFINILNNQEQNYIQSLSENKQFHHWLLETIFQGYIAKDPRLKSALKTTPNQTLCDIDSLIINGLSVHTILCSNNIYLLDYLLQWSTYYRKLYENDGQYNQCLCNFVCLVLSEVFSEISNNVNELEDPNKNIPTKQFIYAFSILFEFFTIFHIGKYFALYKKATIDNKMIAIDVPHYYSSLFKNTLDDNKKDLADKWDNYIFFKTIIAKCCLIWHEKIDYHHLEKYAYDSKYSSKNDIFSKQLRLLIYKEELGYNNSDITNKGIPLIVILSNLMPTIINEIQTEDNLDYWLQVYSQFLIFIIVSSTNMPDVDDYYNRIQDYSKQIISFGICFLVNQYYKTRITIALSNSFLTVIKRLFTLMHRIIKKITDDISKEKAPKKPRMTFSKSNVVKTKGDNAVFRLSCNMTINGHPFFKCFDPQMSDNELKQQLDDNMFKQAIPENAKFKDAVESIFTFSDLWSKRKENIKNIIPLYTTFCSYSSSSRVSSIRLDTNYIESEYYEAKKSNDKIAFDIRIEIDKKLALYQRKCMFCSKQLSLKYNKLKKALFTFRGFWSRQELVYDKKQSLKYKIINHYTNDYTRPLLLPLVDYDYYLPPFSKFSKKKLFFDQNANHSLVEINTEKYFNFNKDEERGGIINGTNTAQIENSTSIDIDHQSNAINSDTNDPLSCIMKSEDASNNNIIRKINKSAFEVFNTCSLIKDNYIFCEFIINSLQYSLSNHELKLNETDKPIPCCYIKQVCHIKGYIANDSQGLLFYAYDWEAPPNSDFYDDERNICYGSIYKIRKEQKINYFKAIPYDKIEKVFLRKAFFIQSALEIFTIYKTSYLFQFWSQEKRDFISSNIQSHLKKEAIKTRSKEAGYENCSHLFSSNANCTISSASSSSLVEKYHQWSKWEISTLEFIMHINIMANRSYSDLSQYPIFPWILTDYSSQVIDYPLRDFTKPIGMLEVFPESILRKKNYIAHYESMLEDKKQRETEDVPYVFGTQSSNAMYACYYLMRLFPFANIKVELQGNSFDNPNRLFNALDISFYCATTQKSDLRELMPEFFCLPEMFRNINDFDFGEIENEETTNVQRIQSVTLPAWCSNDPYAFIERHRRFLESKEASKVISSWVDITFGSKQKTVKEIYNLYREETYDDFEEKYKTLSSIDKGYMCRMLEFGICPSQIFNKEMKPRCNFNEIHQQDELDVNEMVKYPISLKYNPTSIQESSHITIQSLNKKKKLLLITDNTVYSMKLKVKGKEDKDKDKEKNTIEKSNEKEKKEYIYEPKVKFSLLNKDHLMTPIANIKNSNVIVTYNKGRCLIKGGYLNGQICSKYSYKANKQCCYYIQEDMSPIIVLSIAQDEKFLFCGTQCGLIHIYFISQKESPIQLALHKTIADHTDRITALHCNSQLNVFASASSDGYIMLYTMPKCKLFNSIKLPKASEISYLYVSSSPLPCFVYYEHSAFKWNSYSINGEHLSTIGVSQQVPNAKFYTDKLFMDHIVSE